MEERSVYLAPKGIIRRSGPLSKLLPTGIHVPVPVGVIVVVGALAAGVLVTVVVLLVCFALARHPTQASHNRRSILETRAIEARSFRIINVTQA